MGAIEQDLALTQHQGDREVLWKTLAGVWIAKSEFTMEFENMGFF